MNAVNRTLKFLTAALFVTTGISQAAVYKPVLNADSKTGLTFSIPYTFGKHDGEALSLSGHIEIDPETLVVTSGEFSFPVTALSSGNRKRDCHIEESIGLDYSKSSYPKSQVCGGTNTLPTEGNDAIAFPNLLFKMESSTASKTAGEPAVVRGSFEMHGVSKPLEVPILITKNDAGIVRLQGTFMLSMAAYGAVVKPVVGIKVGDPITVTVDVLLKAESSKAQ